MTLSVNVLGPVTLERSGRPVAIGGAKLQLLLAVLVAHRSGTLTPGQLCDALWGDAQPPTATTTVQSHLSRLRRLLEPEAHDRGPRLALRAQGTRGSARRG